MTCRATRFIQLGGGPFGGRRRLCAVAAAAVVAGISAQGAGAAPGTEPSIVAEANVPAVAVFKKPGARRPFVTLGNPNRHGVRLVFLVKDRRPGWEHVYLPMRPDGATGWIRDAQVVLTSDPYRVVVSLGRHSITVYNRRRIFYKGPAGVGRSVTSTPTGRYYLVELLEQANPNGVYGPYAFGTSAFSNCPLQLRRRAGRDRIARDERAPQARHRRQSRLYPHQQCSDHEAGARPAARHAGSDSALAGPGTAVGKRRGWDSNPRTFKGLAVFKTAPFDRSGTPPRSGQR